MSDMFGGNGNNDKSHLLTGMLTGSLRSAKSEIADLRDCLEITKKSLDGVGSKAVADSTEKHAWRELALSMIDELKNPDSPKRLTNPDADIERARLLQQVHRTSFEESVIIAKSNGIYQQIPKAYEMAKEKSQKKVKGYLEELISESALRKSAREKASKA